MLHFYGSRWNLNYTTEVHAQCLSMKEKINQESYYTYNTLLYNTCIALYKSAVIQLLYTPFFYPTRHPGLFFLLFVPTDRPDLRKDKTFVTRKIKL